MVESVSSTDGMLCVDFFEDRHGGFGFEHLRSDPEDLGRWTPVGGFGGLRYAGPVEAVEAAETQIPWLTTEARAANALAAGRSRLTSGQRPDLADELRRMVDRDLAVRERLAATGELFEGYNREMRTVHRQHGDRLAHILAELGHWPGCRLVGVEGSEAAFLIAQHDIANPALMRLSRDLYAEAVADADADPRRLAYLEDRIRMFENGTQRYGTHLGWNNDGEFGLWPPLDEPENVDELRASLGLPLLAEALAAVAAAAERPAHRPVDVVRIEHQQADEFARRHGWRDPD